MQVWIMTKAVRVRALTAHDIYYAGDRYEVPKERADALRAAGLVRWDADATPPLIDERNSRGTRKARSRAAAPDDARSVAPGAGGDGASGGEQGEGAGAGGHGASASVDQD